MQISSDTRSADEANGQLTITVAYAVDRVVVTLAGELDFDVEREVVGTVSAVERGPGVAAIRVDATAIRFIDASGLRCLLAVRQIAKQQGIAFSLTTAHNGPVLRLLELCRLIEFFPGNGV